mmetsp:Transcript_17437/g.26149  ORF Transcript_17437/g.26149 Transcript_17437/m.26149 type:complete len:91 (+) Transcript_17437:238-510(+)
MGENLVHKYTRDTSNAHILSVSSILYEDFSFGFDTVGDGVGTKNTPTTIPTKTPKDTRNAAGIGVAIAILATSINCPKNQNAAFVRSPGG